MKDIPSADKPKVQGLREGPFWMLTLGVMAMLCFGYWALYRQPTSTQSSEQKSASEEKFKAWHAVEYCNERAKALPAGSGEAQIARDACQLLQTQFEQTYRLVP